MLTKEQKDYVERLKESLRTTIELYDEMNDLDYYKSSTKNYIVDLKVQIEYFTKNKSQ
jgi:hypothetical protein